VVEQANPALMLIVWREHMLGELVRKSTVRINNKKDPIDK
jgi:hypothetical protein